MRRVLRLKADLGLFENPYAPANGSAMARPRAPRLVDWRGRAAEESFVLLKNSGPPDQAPIPTAGVEARTHDRPHRTARGQREGYARLLERSRGSRRRDHVESRAGGADGGERNAAPLRRGFQDPGRRPVGLRGGPTPGPPGRRGDPRPRRKGRSNRRRPPRGPTWISMASNSSFSRQSRPRASLSSCCSPAVRSRSDGRPSMRPRSSQPGSPAWRRARRWSECSSVT